MTLDKFLTKYLGQTKGYPTDSSYKGECLSIVKLYIKECFGINPPASGSGSAYGYWSNFPDPLGTVFKKVPNTPDLVPKKGWIVVWKPWSANKYGHIAIVDEGSTKTVLKNFAQNWTSRVFQRESQNYNNVVGFLVPIKENNMPDKCPEQRDAWWNASTKIIKAILGNKSVSDDKNKADYMPKRVDEAIEKHDELKSNLTKEKQARVKKEEELNAKIDSISSHLNAEIDKVSQELAECEKSKAGLKGEVTKKEKEIAELRAQLETCKELPIDDVSADAKMLKLFLYLGLSSGLGYVSAKYVANDPELMVAFTPAINIIIYVLEQRIGGLKALVGGSRLKKTDK